MNDLSDRSGDSIKAGTDMQMLDHLLRETFQYFIKGTNEKTGLIADSTQKDSPASISVVGMGISVFIVAVENGMFSREKAIFYVARILRFFRTSKQGTGEFDTGYKGFYYHFLDMDTGRRAWNSELSTIDTAFLMGGMLHASVFFNGETPEEAEIRTLADELYCRVNWQWSLASSTSITHGWKPKTGFLSSNWDCSYSEAMILYLLAMGSPTHPISNTGFHDWVKSFQLKKRYGIEYIYAGPLFIHQFSHLWIDFKSREDVFNRKAGFTYFENSRRATYVHREYAIRNAKKYKAYSKYFWGLSASNGPGNKTLDIDGMKRKFYGYRARGAPYGPDDGTVSPWSVVASLPFAPEIVLDTIRHCIEDFGLQNSRLFGFEASFNPTYPDKSKNKHGWVSPHRYGLNQGAIIMMIENYRSSTVWKSMNNCSYLNRGLEIAGFSNIKTAVL